MNTCTSGARRRGIRAIGPYDYVSGGETLEKVSYSIGSAWFGAGAAFDESGHSEVGGTMEEWMGTRSVFLWRPVFL